MVIRCIAGIDKLVNRQASTTVSWTPMEYAVINFSFALREYIIR